ncbi:nitroreductase family protein [Streptosporangium pseudovulgare]|uniref:Nitroreductase domain-containing protein n=1 Tax=Streptosporangium pseudovulgare TaxID=35765 RepID=A0ABQ2QVK5_9ACTN|nr:nitroreductase family protein [Streptosporangium pseudovulgare]GGP95454.1 hypothetical protein GCM10010140_26860 [Streptosporangium pseudovulgare]
MTALRDHMTLFTLLREQSRLTAEDVRRGPRPGPGRIRPAGPREAGPDLPEVRTAPAPPTARPLEEILRNRVSIRDYADEAVPAGVVAASLATAFRLDREGWPDDCAAGHRLGVLVAARGIDGLRPAVYRADEDGARLVPLAGLADGRAAEEMVLQIEYAASPVILAVTGSLSAALDRHGAHGHRSLMARAAGFAYAAMIQAAAYGLTGSVFAGFLQSGLRPLVDLDGYRNRQLFAVSLGYPRH